MITRILKLFDDIGNRHIKRDVFLDLIAVSSIAVQNTYYTNHDDIFEYRQREYVTRMSKYSNEDCEIMSKMLGYITLAINERINDYLGEIFMNIATSSEAGQYFTPFNTALLSSKLSISDECLKYKLDSDKKIRLHEPTCGGGAMILALAKRIKELGFEPSSKLIVRASDIDINCVYITYLQLSLLGIDAVITKKDILSNDDVKPTCIFTTPQHILLN